MALRSTLDRRFWAAAAGGTLLALLVLGIPSAVLPNAFFIRMLPTEPVNVVTWLLSAPLVGLILATYLAPPRVAGFDPGRDGGSVPASAGGVAAYLAIGCPICNKIIVAILGVSGAVGVFGPLQPIIGAGSIALLGATLVWRLRLRVQGCARCVPAGSAVAPSPPAR
ncbi:MAG: hypothetical protein IVW53_14190 [Chloroflexi bacterium]|nr:hypothetical protein [Chloroflexota bacterium]